jgi:hypothetical protein
MGLLNRIFGSGENKAFHATTDTMPEIQFWNIIEESNIRSGGNFEKQQEILKKLLSQLSPQEIILFDNKFRQLKGEAYDWNLWGAIYIINGGCSDDSFNDFREWVISQGKDFYSKTLNDPETLATYSQSISDIEWEGLGYVPTTVFEEITGSEMPPSLMENQEIKGEEWEENNDDLKDRFPKLWAKYNTNTING